MKPELSGNCGGRTTLPAVVFLLVFIALTGGFGKKDRSTLVPVSGRIFDSATHKPLPGVEVSYKETKTYSGNNGAYRILIPAGICDLAFRFAERPVIHKSAVARSSAQPVSLDALIPSEATSGAKKRLLTERGSRSTREGTTLASDYHADSMISLSDESGNDPDFLMLNLGTYRAHSPAFGFQPGEILFGLEGVVHDKKEIVSLGLYQYTLSSRKSLRLASGQPLLFVDIASGTNTVVAATSRSIFLFDKSAEQLKNIHSEPPGNFLLSVAWGPDGRIYFTVEEPVRRNAAATLTRCRIASILPTGAELNSHWAADPEYSYRYPASFGEEIIYSRLTLDGRNQELWSRRAGQKDPRLILKDALRAIHYDPSSGTIYYVFRGDLHLREMKTGFDAIIQNSVENGELR